MTNNDLLIWGIYDVLVASKNVDYRVAVARQQAALMTFLHENKLLINLNPFDECGNMKIDTLIYRRNLTEEGWQLFKQGVVDKWFSYLSKSKSYKKYSNISLLEKGLANIRQVLKEQGRVFK